MLLAKQTLEFAYGHFNEMEIEYLNGEIDLVEAARRIGISEDAFRKRLERRRRDFKNAVSTIERSTP